MSVSDLIIGGAAIAGGTLLAYRNWEERQVTVAVSGMVKQVAPKDDPINRFVDDRIMNKNVGIAIGAAIAIGGAALLISRFSDD